MAGPFPPDGGTCAILPQGRVAVCRLGRRDHEATWELQRRLRQARAEGAVGDTLLLVEHPPTITLGRATRADQRPDGDALRAAGIALVEIERGGSATYHGPGQLVGYPVVDLRSRGRDVHRFLRQLEQAMIGALGAFDLDAGTRAGLTGVWVGPGRDRKIASIGIHLRQWISLHGFALNVATDLGPFGFIRPCGLDAAVMTTMARELGTPPPLRAVEDAVVRSFADAFGVAAHELQEADLC